MKNVGGFSNNKDTAVSIDDKCLDCLHFAINTFVTGKATSAGIKGVEFRDRGYGPELIKLVDAGYMSLTMVEQHTKEVRAGIYYNITTIGYNADLKQISKQN